MISNFWMGHGQPVYKKNNLIYVSTPKCASTLYCNVAEYNSWEKINFNDINWSLDHVFGFIMDPVELYLKGLAEDLDTDKHMELFKELFEMNLDRNRNITLLTAHSILISNRYQEYRHKIDWIPINSKPNTEFFFKKLCNKHGIDVEISNTMSRHTSTQSKLERYQELKNMFGNFNETFYKIFSTDIDFYHTVHTNFNPNGQSWDEISWLKNYVAR